MSDFFLMVGQSIFISADHRVSNDSCFVLQPGRYCTKKGFFIPIGADSNFLIDVLNDKKPLESLGVIPTARGVLINPEGEVSMVLYSSKSGDDPAFIYEDSVKSHLLGLSKIYRCMTPEDTEIMATLCEILNDPIEILKKFKEHTTRLLKVVYQINLIDLLEPYHDPRLSFSDIVKTGYPSINHKVIYMNRPKELRINKEEEIKANNELSSRSRKNKK